MWSRLFRRSAILEIWDEAEAGQIGVVRERVEAGARVNARRKPPVEPLKNVLIERVVPVHWTPLMYASWFGHADVVRYLLSVGAGPNLEDFEKNTALDCAVIQGHDDVVAILLELGAEARHQDKTGRTARDYAAMASHEAILKRLLVVYPSATLHEALAYNDIEGAERLLANGADPYATDYMGRSPWELARALEHTEYLAVLEKHGVSDSTPQT